MDVFSDHAPLVQSGRSRTRRNVNDISERAGSHYLCSTRQSIVGLDAGFTWDDFTSGQCLATVILLHAGNIQPHRINNSQLVWITSNCYLWDQLQTCWRASSNVVSMTQAPELRCSIRTLILIWTLFHTFIYHWCFKLRVKICPRGYLSEVCDVGHMLTVDIAAEIAFLLQGYVQDQLAWCRLTYNLLEQ